MKTMAIILIVVTLSTAAPHLYVRPVIDTADTVKRIEWVDPFKRKRVDYTIPLIAMYVFTALMIGMRIQGDK